MVFVWYALSLETWLIVSCDFALYILYFTVANIILKALFVKALNDQMHISEICFFLDKVQTNFFPLRSCRWFDYNHFTSLTLPIHALNFSLTTLSLVGNDIYTVQYAKSGPLSESDIGGVNQVLL